MMPAARKGLEHARRDMDLVQQIGGKAHRRAGRWRDRSNQHRLPESGRAVSGSILVGRPFRRRAAGRSVGLFEDAYTAGPGHDGGDRKQSSQGLRARRCVPPLQRRLRFHRSQPAQRYVDARLSHERLPGQAAAGCDRRQGPRLPGRRRRADGRHSCKRCTTSASTAIYPSSYSTQPTGHKTHTKSPAPH